MLNNVDKKERERGEAGGLQRSRARGNFPADGGEETEREKSHEGCEAGERERERERRRS